MADFVGWLNQELDRRGWSRSEAARRGGFSSSMFDKVVSGYANPGLDFCRGIATAFQLPLEDVFRLAGILPPKPAATRETRLRYRVGNQVMPDGVAELFNQLTNEEQDAVVRLMETMAARGEPRIIGEPAADESG